jgi:hypothetical protein
MSDQRNRQPSAVEAHRYRIVPIGTGPIGWAIERDGKVWRTGPRLEVLGAWLDALLAGASTHDADDIAKVIERDPIPVVSKGGDRPAF